MLLLFSITLLYLMSISLCATENRALALLLSNFTLELLLLLLLLLLFCCFCRCCCCCCCCCSCCCCCWCCCGAVVAVDVAAAGVGGCVLDSAQASIENISFWGACRHPNQGSGETGKSKWKKWPITTAINCKSWLVSISIAVVENHG